MADKLPPDGDGAAPPPRRDILPIAIEDEMKRSYLDYAMSVIVSRALPDVRDGLKPVHRRILHAMNEAGYHWNRPYRKSARVVGDVIGKYHPHGEGAVYAALVRQAQDFSMRLPVLDGQGNFGSMDNDPPAAMRYTEVRLARPAHALLEDIDKDTVNFQDNYDNSEREPLVLPARFPNLLVNGAGGIAVGMATNIPPHNLGEVIDACFAYLDDPGIALDALFEIVPGPDFPTGGIILGRSGARHAAYTGRGSVVLRSRARIEEIRKEREAIVVTEIPYQVNKATMVEKIAELVREKRVEGIADLRDESDREGVRVVIELRRDAVADVVLNQLYRYSPLQTSFGVNMLALLGGRPRLLNLKDMIAAFVAFREEVITRRTRFELGKARDRAHVLVGLAIAVANIDAVIALIRAAPDPATARAELMGRDWPAGDMRPLVELIADPRHVVSVDGACRLSELQARAILELRLQRLTALGRDEVAGELQELRARIEDYLDILRSRPRVLDILRGELAEVRAAFATPRRTEIVDAEMEVEDEDLIQREDMVVTVTHGGYIKRVPLSTYRAQRRGGRGRSGMATREEDFVTQVFVANTHTPLLFFSSAGMVYKMKVWRLPLATPQARGKAMVNLLPLSAGEGIAAIMALPEDEASWERLNVMFATLRGDVRRNELSDFVNVRANGKIAMKLNEGDSIVGVRICTVADDVLLTTRLGKAIRFPVSDVRVFRGRDSTGVRGIRLADSDEVIALSTLSHIEATVGEAREYLKRAAEMRRATGGDEEDEAAPTGASEDDEVEKAGDEAVALSTDRYAQLSAHDQMILTLTENGFGKRTSAYEYRLTRRGGQGIRAIDMTERNGPIVASFPIEDGDQIVAVTNGGQMIRVPVDDIRIAGRATQGVWVFRPGEDERVVSAVAGGDLTNGDNGDQDENDGDEADGDDGEPTED